MNISEGIKRSIEEIAADDHDSEVTFEEGSVEESMLKEAYPASHPAAPFEGQPGEENSSEKKRHFHEPPAESMDDYAKELDASLIRIKRGDVMECTVVSFDESGVVLDLDYYAPGKISSDEMSEDPDFSVMRDVTVGEKFKGIVIQTDDGSGNIVLSKKQADKEFAWDKLIDMMNDKTVVECRITEAVRGGAVAYVEGIRGFIPASKLSLKYVEDTKEYAGRKMKLQIIEADRDEKKLVLSAKELLTQEALARKSENISRLSAGTVIEGTVEKITSYGAFVNIGDGLTGLLHISQISEKHIKHPSEVLKAGQSVSVMILNIDDDRISLSMKAVQAAVEEEEAEEARSYHSEYRPDNPFAALLKNIKLDDQK